MTLKDAVPGKEYIVRSLNTNDDEMDSFLFSLGCYVGEPITVIAHKRGGCVISVKDGRYSIAHQLAPAISI